MDYHGSMKGIQLPILLLILFTAVMPRLHGQHTIRGVVRDIETGETLPAVNVFLANTLNGSSSDANGRFEITGIEEGIYELVVSHISYKAYTQVIDTKQLKSFYTIELESDPVEMDEIVVEFDEKRWQSNYNAFLNDFLGYSPFARRTEIINPEILRFDFNADSLTLRAEARGLLKIENHALGYRINYSLEKFESDYRDHTNFLAGKFFFEQMESRNADQLARWAVNREKAYFGSFRHFIDSILNGTAAENQFLVRRERVHNDRRIVESQLLNIDSVLHENRDGIYLLRFENRLNIQYTGEKEDPEYLRLQNRFRSGSNGKPGIQKSFMFLAKDSLAIDASGYIYNPLDIIVGGYWAYEKIPQVLPMNYTPEAVIR